MILPTDSKAAVTFKIVRKQRDYTVNVRNEKSKTYNKGKEQSSHEKRGSDDYLALKLMD